MSFLLITNRNEFFSFSKNYYNFFCVHLFCKNSNYISSNKNRFISFEFRNILNFLEKKGSIWFARRLVPIEEWHQNKLWMSRRRLLCRHCQWVCYNLSFINNQNSSFKSLLDFDPNLENFNLIIDNDLDKI